MSRIVHLKWGEQPSDPLHLMITRFGRIRGEDFVVDRCQYLRSNEIGERRTFASLTTALREAETEAQTCGVDTIYVRQP